MTSSDTPCFVVPDTHLIPQHTYLADMFQIPPSRMSLIRAAMREYVAEHGPDATVYDASQGDGGMYLPGVTPELHDRANAIMKRHGTAYDYPYGCDAFREAVIEQYWGLDPALGWGPQNVIALGKHALAQGIDFVIYDWIYHYVTAGDPVDANVVLGAFTPDERERLIILDGITKALGASNVRGAHLLAGRDLIAFMNGRAAYSVVPHIHGQAVALAAFEMGYREAAAPVVEPTNASRAIVREFLTQHGYRFILGDGGYYAFIDVRTAQEAGGFADVADLCEHLTRVHGIATVPGTGFSEEGNGWLRVSFALPPEVTRGALERLHTGLRAVEAGVGSPV